MPYKHEDPRKFWDTMREIDRQNAQNAAARSREYDESIRLAQQQERDHQDRIRLDEGMAFAQRNEQRSPIQAPSPPRRSWIDRIWSLCSFAAGVFTFCWILVHTPDPTSSAAWIVSGIAACIVSLVINSALVKHIVRSLVRLAFFAAAMGTCLYLLVQALG